MIEKFINIKNIGRFRDCSPRGDVTFRKLTLLFAENGFGKTTLCAILRSLQTGRKEFISERKSLGEPGLPSVQIRLDGNTETFLNNVWSVIHPNITLFDSVFIHDNVYAGDYVDHDHKKHLYRVIVGAQGVELANQIEELDNRIRKANEEIKTKKGAVLTTLPSGVTLDDYLTWQLVIDIEDRIQKKNTEITNRKLILERASEIMNIGLLTQIALPTFASDFLTILAKELADLTAGAETHIQQQIAAHNMGKEGETWLSQGLSFVLDERCPFCDQGVHDNELIAAYQSYFNAAYEALKQEVRQLSQCITSALGETTLNATQQKLLNNAILVDFWKQFAEMALPDLVYDDIHTKYATLRDLALVLTQRKQQTPTESIAPDIDFQGALNEVTVLQQSLQAYNIAVDACNTLISAQKTAAQQGGDIEVLKIELADLEAKKKRFDLMVVQACKEYMEALTAKTILEQQKTTVRQRLDAYCQQILVTYEQAINTYLGQFNAGFRITNSRHLYTGGTPSCHYQIQINNTAIDVGDSRTQTGTPCFKTTLSSGDRSALALAFFLAALKQGTQLSDKIVVFDDPFTSLDRFRRTCTQQLIRQIAGLAKQVIVLSHDAHFLNLVWEGYAAADIKVLQLCRAGDNTMIGEWDIEAEIQSTYIKNYSTLLNFSRDCKGIPLDVARAIRPFIEGLLRTRFPRDFKTNEWLGEFIDKIQNASDTDGLFLAKADLPEIVAINAYSRKYHHAQNANADSEPLSAEELNGFVKRTLMLVGSA